MSSKGGYAAAAPPRQAGDRFYNPPAVRRHQQILMQQEQQQQLVQRQLIQQQQQQQQHEQQLQQQQQRQLERRARVKADSAAEKRSEGDDSSVAAAALAVPPSAGPASSLKLSNLDRLMESVTPFIEARYLSEGNTKGLRTPEVDSHAFFYLEDLWESFGEWSVYGAGVPLLLNGRDPIKQYYVPFLSGLQLYFDPSKTSSRLRGSTKESDGDSYRLTSSVGSSNSDGDKSLLDSNLQRLNRLSNGDKSEAADIANSSGLPLFQFLEHEQPYNRRPLTDKISLLASQHPELSKCRSCDLLPTSWICVAWYPIYRIPVGSTLQDLDASFLTFHSLSTQSKSNSSPPPQFHAANTRTVYGFSDPTAKISLPVFALASYKLKGSIVSPCGPQECEQENSLLQAADDWLRRLQVMLPDYQFFRSHYSTWR